MSASAPLPCAEGPAARAEVALTHGVRARVWAASVATLVLVALSLGLAGTTTVPLDGHEMLVVETAREMARRGDWIVPWFDGEPRLVKPPLSYWLTGAIARARGRGDAPTESDGRLPSVLAGAGLVVLTVRLGRRLFDARVGLLGGALLVATRGFFGSVHSARPDMLYAFWSMTGIVAFAEARAAPSFRGRLVAALAMWTAFGLATLTKGPQVPLLVVAAAVLLCALERRSPRAIAGILQPWIGVPLLLAIAAPWWWLLRQRVGADALAGTQVQGALWQLRWGRLFDPFYWHRPLELVLPWIVLAPGLFLTARRGPRNANARALGVLIVVAVVGFSVGTQRRLLYLLPYLGLGCLLFARAAVALADAGPRWRRWLRRTPYAFATALAGALLWTLPRAGAEERWRAAAIALTTLCCAGLAVRLRTRDGAVTASVGMLVLAGILAAPSPWIRGERRFAAAELGGLARGLPASVPFGVWGQSLSPAAYYAERPVAVVRSPADVLAALASAGDGALALLLPPSALAELDAAGIATKVLARRPERSDLLLVLVAGESA